MPTQLQRLKSRLRDLGKSQRQLAAFIPTDEAAILKCLAGTRRFKTSELDRWAQFLEWPVDKVLEELGLSSKEISAAKQAVVEKDSESDIEANFNERFISAVKIARIGAGFTQVEMARKLSINLDAYKKYETRSPLPHYLIARFCLHTGRSLADLLA
jgi:DNA-binding XRE family transcriptional regulator